jgi:hypothetical protein
MLFPVHFAVRVNTAQLKDESFKRGHKIKPGVFALKHFGNIFTKWDGHGYRSHVHKNNTYVFCVHLN